MNGQGDSCSTAGPARAGAGRMSAAVFIARESFRSFAQNRNFGSAATLAYYGFLSLMPLLLVVAYVLSLAMQSSQAVLDGMSRLAEQVFPNLGEAILKDLLNLARQKAWGLASVVLLLWSATPFAGAIRDALAGIFKSGRKLRFLKAKLFDFAAVLAILCLFVFLAAGRTIHVDRLVESAAPWQALRAFYRSAGTLALTATVLCFFYAAFAPVRLRLTQLLAGALAAAALLAVIRPLFELVLRFNPNYGYAFGSLKAVFLVIVWSYYTFAVVLFGAEVIATARRKDALLLKGFLLGGQADASPRPRLHGRLIEKFTRVCGADEVLFAEGDPGSDMFFVLSGAVTLTKSGLQLAVMKGGHYFGEMSMLLGAPRTATARVAEAGTRLVRIAQDNFDTILGENPEIVRSILKELALRLQRTNEQLQRK